MFDRNRPPSVARLGLVPPRSDPIDLGCVAPPWSGPDSVRGSAQERWRRDQAAISGLLGPSMLLPMIRSVEGGTGLRPAGWQRRFIVPASSARVIGDRRRSPRRKRRLRPRGLRSANPYFSRHQSTRVRRRADHRNGPPDDEVLAA